MQFRVALWFDGVDIGSVERELQAMDPAALVDIAGDDDQLRIATSMTATELCAAIARTGYPVAPNQVVRMPAECCGGCGG